MATIKLTRDFKEFLHLLNSEKIEYLLIGGYAVGLYGWVRPTKDIDIWVAVDPANEKRLVEALVKFGFPRGGLQLPLFPEGKSVLRTGMPPNRLEILSKIAGVEFADCYGRRRVMDIDGLQVNVIDYEDLVKNKRSTGRTSDQADVERLEKRRNKP